MSTDDRLTMALYNAEQRRKREQPDPEPVTPAPEGHEPTWCGICNSWRHTKPCGRDDCEPSCAECGHPWGWHGKMAEACGRFKAPADAQTRPTPAEPHDLVCNADHTRQPHGAGCSCLSRARRERDEARAELAALRESNAANIRELHRADAELGALRASVSPDAGTPNAADVCTVCGTTTDLVRVTQHRCPAHALPPDAGTLREMQREAFMAGWAAYHHELDPDHECAAWLATRTLEQAWATRDPKSAAVPALVAEVRRLRGLVASAEWSGCDGDVSGCHAACQFCGADYVTSDEPPVVGRHFPHCPAFGTGAAWLSQRTQEPNPTPKEPR